MHNQFRYPGPNPFSAEQVDVFFGRDQDAETLCNSILLNRCTILVGKSGIGKSSLVNAKVIPYFKANAGKLNIKRQFLVLRITVGPFTPTQETSNYETLLEKIRKKVRLSLGKLPEYPFLPFLSEVYPGSLGYDLKQYQHKALLENQPTTFLLIVDQVEELFTYPYSEFKEIIASLNEILSPNVPSDVRDIIELVESKQPNLITTKETETLYTPLLVKFLFSIRSDKLGLLIRLKEAVSDIFSNPYELRPLSKEQAYKAIKMPAEKEGMFDTLPFKITDEAIDKVIDFLWNLPNSDLESNFDELKIDPITLQIVCQHIEQKLLPVSNEKIIRSNDISKFEEVFANYYLDVLSQLQLDDLTLIKVRELIEERLIYEPDKRRRQLFFDECEVNILHLKNLIQLKFLREVTSGTNNNYIEIGHDWLVLPILIAKKKRLEDESRKKEERIKTTINSESIANEILPTFHTMKKKGSEMYVLKEYQQAINYYNGALKDENSRNFSAELADLYLKRGECYHKLKEYNNSNKDLTEVLIIDSTNVLAKFYMAFNTHLQNDFEKAAVIYNEIIDIDPTYVNAYFNLGFVYGAMQDYEKSKRMFLIVTDESPNDADAWYNAGVMANNQYYFAEALGYLKNSIKIKPAYANAYIEMGYAYFELESYEQALSTYNRVIEYEPTNTEVYLGSADDLTFD